MKLTEKELNEFPIGTKIYTNGNIFIKTGYSLYVKDNITECFWENKEVIIFDAKKVEIPTYTEYIPPKPILDDKEKEYLSAIVMPYKKKIKYIVKEKLCCNNGKSKEYIAISFLNSIDSFELPLFKPNVMYKGMELGREYTLEELGL